MKKLRPILLIVFLLIFIPISNYNKIHTSIATPLVSVWAWKWVSGTIFGAVLYIAGVDGKLKFKPDWITLALAVVTACILIVPTFVPVFKPIILSDLEATFIRVAFGFVLCKGLLPVEK